MTEECGRLVLLHVILSRASADAESKNPLSFGSAYGILAGCRGCHPYDLENRQSQKGRGKDAGELK